MKLAYKYVGGTKITKITYFYDQYKTNRYFILVIFLGNKYLKVFFLANHHLLNDSCIHT